MMQHRADVASKRLLTIPGIGIIGATAIAATVTDPKAFRSGRDMAAWIGLVPRQDSTGGAVHTWPIATCSGAASARSLTGRSGSGGSAVHCKVDAFDLSATWT